MCDARGDYCTESTDSDSERRRQNGADRRGAIVRVGRVVAFAHARARTHTHKQENRKRTDKRVRSYERSGAERSWQASSSPADRAAGGRHSHNAAIKHVLVLYKTYS